MSVDIPHDEEKGSPRVPYMHMHSLIQFICLVASIGFYRLFAKAGSCSCLNNLPRHIRRVLVWRRHVVQTDARAS